MHRLPLLLRTGVLVWLVGLAAMLGWNRAERLRAVMADGPSPGVQAGQAGSQAGQALQAGSQAGQAGAQAEAQMGQASSSQGRPRVGLVSDRSGSKLRIQVEEGDTLFSLARRYGVALADLLRANRQVELIVPGQELALPATSTELAAELRPYQGLFRWPIDGPLTSPFGPRWGRMHTGIDFAADEGAPIRAARSGKVTTAGAMNDYGLTVVLTHPDGTRTLYGHCSKLMVKEGQEVSAGEMIAEVGSTGFSTGPHLHFEIHVADEPRNPLPLLLRND